MQKKISFVGIGIESGQTLSGLSYSSRFARTNLRELTEFTDFGDILSKEPHQKIFSEAHLDKVDFRSYEKAAKIIMSAMHTHDFHLNWGGDHSIAWATISAFLYHYPQGKVVWIDAHADLNKPETSPTGNLHGMPLSFSLGLNRYIEPKALANRLRPEQIIYVGLRSLDRFEIDTIQRLSIPHFDMGFIRQYGMSEVCKQLNFLVGNFPVHVSFDIDSLDPKFAPSTGVPVADGLSFAQLQFLADFMNQHFSIKSLDIVEVNPMIGDLRQVQQTYNLAFAFLKNFIPHKKRGKNAFKFSSIKRKFPASQKWGFPI